MKRFKKISAILCAAGLSRRMGKENKLLLKLNDKSFISQSIEELLKSPIHELIVVIGYEMEEMIQELEPYLDKITIVVNTDFENGQTSSIHAGLKKMDTFADAVMICLADMPLLECQHYARLIQHFSQDIQNVNKLITRPINKQSPGHPVIMSKEFIPQLLRCDDAEGCKSVIKANKESLNPFYDTELAYYRDIDTSESYKKLLKE